MRRGGPQHAAPTNVVVGVVADDGWAGELDPEQQAQAEQERRRAFQPWRGSLRSVCGARGEIRLVRGLQLHDLRSGSRVDTGLNRNVVRVGFDKDSWACGSCEQFIGENRRYESPSKTVPLMYFQLPCRLLLSPVR